MINKNLNLNHSPEFDITDILWDKNIIERYNFGHMYLSIKKEKIEEFKNEIMSSYNVKTFLYPYGSVKTYILENNNIYVQIDERKEKVDVYIFTKTRELSKELFEIYMKYKETSNNYISIEEYVFENGKVNAYYKTITLKDVENISKDFYPFLDIDLLIEMFLKGKENLLILAGEPGTGKSKFISYLFKWVLENEESNSFIVSSAKDINLLSMDAFWKKAESAHLVVLDDLDFMLGSRNDSREDIQKNNFLSKLLSFTDGVINNKTKIIITTNQPIDEIDTALLRDGRIFDILNFRPLKKKEAEKILKKYNIDYEIKDDYVPQSKIGSIIENYLKTGTYERKYLKEDNISLLHKKLSKSIGFI